MSLSFKNNNLYMFMLIIQMCNKLKNIHILVTKRRCHME